MTKLFINYHVQQGESTIPLVRRPERSRLATDPALHYRARFSLYGKRIRARFFIVRERIQFST